MILSMPFWGVFFTIFKVLLCVFSNVHSLTSRLAYLTHCWLLVVINLCKELCDIRVQSLHTYTCGWHSGDKLGRGISYTSGHRILVKLGVINHPRPSPASQIWTVTLSSLSWNIVPSSDTYIGMTPPINSQSVTWYLSSKLTMPRLRHPFDTRPVHCRLRHCLITFPLLSLRDFSRFLLTTSPPPSRMFRKLLGTASQSQVTRRKQLPHGHYLPSQTGYQECSESFLFPDFCVNQ